MSEQHAIYELEIGGTTMPVREVRGREALSEPYRYVVEAYVPEGMEVDPDGLVRTEVSLLVVRDEVVRTLRALVSEVYVEYSVQGAPELTVILEPRIAWGRFRQDVRCFLDKDVPTIVTEVLGGFGVSVERRLGGSYAARAYCVQFRESDLHFASRLLEEEGIFYFVSDEGTVVLGDSASAYDPVSGPTVVPFRFEAGMSQEMECVWALGERALASVGKVSLRDWNPEAPSLPMDVSAPGPTPAGPEFYDYPGEYGDPGVGQQIANLTAEAFRCRAETVSGRAHCPGFGAGRTFTLEDAPTGTRSLVLTMVEQSFHRDRGGHETRFEALPAEVVFRPERRHEEPILPNPLTGFVTGPPGEDIHTDELGRVKVHFHWDRVHPPDDRCSDWVPVLQDNTGESIGIPRIGWEVLVHFLEGDPDRPVVLGRVYNAEDTFPFVLPRDKMRTALKSLSSPTRDGTNTIQIDDTAGQEMVFVHAEKDQNIVVAHDRDERILVNRQRKIERDETIRIANNQAEVVHHDAIRDVSGDQTLAIGANRKRDVGSIDQSSVEGDRTVIIGGKHQRRIGTEDQVSVKSRLSETIGAVVTELSLDGNATEARKALVTLVGGAVVEAAKEQCTETASKARAEITGAVVFDKAKGEHQIQAGKKRITLVGGAKKVKAGKELTISAIESLDQKSLAALCEGAEAVNLKVGECMVTLKEGVITIKAPKTISMDITAQNEQGAKESFQI
jgi:type VI secretion system secreted protein VgrG